MQTAEHIDFENTRYQSTRTSGSRKNSGRGASGIPVEVRKRLLLKTLVMGAIILVLCIGFTAYGTSINYQINSTNKQIEDIQNEIENLNLKVTANMSPEIIEEKAINELGMEYPSASQYVYIDSGATDVYTADNK